MNVAPLRSLNSYWSMPFARSAKITLTHEGAQNVGALYYNIDYRRYAKAPAGVGYFHAQYRQAAPNKGTSTDWANNGDAKVNDKKNLAGEGNYVFLEAAGRGHFVGVTHSVLQNQDYWWGEGDEMIFVDGAAEPQITGTGSEDYYTGSWDFQKPFSFPYAGAPLVGVERAGSRSMAYRFHVETRSRSRSRSRSRWSTATPTIARTTGTRWRTGTRRAARAVPAAASVDERIPKLMQTAAGNK
jgi:hypothetical protein